MFFSNPQALFYFILFYCFIIAQAGRLSVKIRVRVVSSTRPTGFSVLPLSLSNVSAIEPNVVTIKRVMVNQRQNCLGSWAN
jgi:hypothetical protein